MGFETAYGFETVLGSETALGFRMCYIVLNVLELFECAGYIGMCRCCLNVPDVV
jgi:hypothetical protein